MRNITCPLSICVCIFIIFFFSIVRNVLFVFFPRLFTCSFNIEFIKSVNFSNQFGFFPNHLFIFNSEKKCLMDMSIKPKSMSREYRLIDFYWNNWIRIEMMLTITNTTLLTHTHTHTLNFDVFCPLVFLVKQSYENSIECEFNENRNTNYPILITIRGFCSFYNMPFPNEIYQRFFSSSNFDPIFMPTK